MKKVINGICVVLAFVCVGLGAIGIVVPILPTTPLFLAAAVLFAKGSKRFHQWFLSTKLYRNHLEDLVITRSMTKKSKLTVLTTITVLFTIGFFAAPIWHAKSVIAIVAAAHYYVLLFRIRTVSEEEKARQKAESKRREKASA